ncbi:hypothetical protein I4U23_028030 [Adineta vaga]|nr:hypothetical protein I4U23_028030 [Adineta vaga]
MTEQSMFNFQIMTNITRIFLWCWSFLALIQTIYSNSIQAQWMSFCNQTINMSSPLSLIFTPSSLSNLSCCNLTLIKPTSTEQILVNMNITHIIPSFHIFNKQLQSIDLIRYSLFNRTYFRSNILDLPLTFSLCQFNIQPFEILISNISKGPCFSNQYRCLINNQDQWCIDEKFPCDGYHLCPQGIEEHDCSKSMSKLILPKMRRTISGGIVTTIIIFGLLLIISSVSIAVAFVYFQRKRQRRRQFTYSLESTSDDWEPSGTGYHLFDNWTTNRRDNTDNIIIDANEHMPITNR